MTLPLDLIAEIVRLGEPIDWDGNYIFQEILRAQAKEGIQAKKVKIKSKPLMTEMIVIRHWKIRKPERTQPGRSGIHP